jgi:DNA invertase Pin-like site-specific DNA recombinase
MTRLARSTRDLLNTLVAIAAANATFAWADTTTPRRLILTVLGGLAEFERHLIIAPARARASSAPRGGVLFGRPRKLHQRREAIARRDEGFETLTDIARSYNVSYRTISSLR